VAEDEESGALAQRIATSILDFVARIPASAEPVLAEPDARARAIAGGAATKAAMAAGTLGLPVGPAGWLTILPELVVVWKIQEQMVADLAGVYGKQAALTREQMVYCLFRHSAAQVVRDLVVRVGERMLVRNASLRVLQTVAEKIGVRVTQRVIGKSLSRWVPVVGALGVGAYAYYDTGQVAKTAIDLFKREIELLPVADADGGRSGAA
jgi:hypothetical protein